MYVRADLCGTLNVLQNKKTALHMAARNGHTATVAELIRLGADVNARNSNDDASIHLAAEGGHTATVIELVRLGADVNAKGWVSSRGSLRGSECFTGRPHGSA